MARYHEASTGASVRYSVQHSRAAGHAQRGQGLNIPSRLSDGQNGRFEGTRGCGAKAVGALRLDCSHRTSRMVALGAVIRPPRQRFAEPRPLGNDLRSWCRRNMRAIAVAALEANWRIGRQEMENG